MKCFFFSNCNTPEPKTPQYCNSVLHKSCEYYKKRVEERLNRMRIRQSRESPLTVQECFDLSMRRNTIDTYSNTEFLREGAEL